MTISPTAVQSYTYTGTFKATNGQTLTCSAPLIVTGGGGGGGGCTSNCGGGGGGTPSPTITLTALPRVNAQPLAYLYLSQIPYTGLDLGPIGTVLYWLALIGWALALAYLIIFGAAPFANRSLRNFGARVFAALNAPEFAPVEAIRSTPRAQESALDAAPEAPRGYSSYDGFKSFSRNGALSIDDIVKSLSHKQSAPIAARNVEPIFNVEPVYEQVEEIQAMPAVEASAPASIRGFVSALIEGDRVAVFAGLRQHVRGGGSPERLVSDTVCLLDDVYRSRIDGTVCDADIARVTARLSTPVLEKLVASLATAIDSSYSTGVTGAKLALTRALAVLGA